MKHHFSYIVVLGIVMFTSCENAQKKETHSDANAPEYNLLRKLSWLPGTWAGTSPEGVFGESWQEGNDSLYNGKGFFVVGKDTVSSESLRLLQEGSKLFYEPTVKNQNDGKAVRFEMTELTDNTCVFENAAHDFPQKISYTLVTPDSLVAEISGLVEGKARSEVFPMARRK